MAGKTRALTPGHAAAVPPGPTHGGVTGPDGSLVLERFGPLREDHLASATTAGRADDV
jgi:hypothetical protein